MSTAAAPAINLLKDVAISFFIMAALYGGFLFWLKSRIKDRQQFWLYKNLAALAAIALLGIYMFFKFTHK